MEQEFYYCDNCYHVYYEKPKEEKCIICNNEIKEIPKLPQQAILTCETCHALYTPQTLKEIIKEIENPYSLCGCKNKCPSESTLALSPGFGYYGTITLADVYQCSNCGAIYYRNAEEKQRKCHVCNSQFIYPLKIDPETQKVFFRCANKDHGIRLKLRDLIYHNNALIEEQMKNIKPKEEQLKAQYEQSLNAIMNQKLKSKSKKEIEKKQLDQWALKERKKLYEDFHSNPMRCVVYIQNPDGSLTLTNKGCGALAKIKIRKIMETDLKATVIDRTPKVDKTPKTQEKIEEEKEKEESVQEAPETLILTHEHTQETQEEEIEKLLKNIQIPEPMQQIQKILKDLPELPEKQVILSIIIGLKKQDKEVSINYGILPFIPQENTEFEIDRNIILQALWAKPENFLEEKIKKIIQNIPAREYNTSLIRMKVKENTLSMEPEKETNIPIQTQLKEKEIDMELPEYELTKLGEYYLFIKILPSTKMDIIINEA